jgi:hypothetical protein
VAKQIVVSPWQLSFDFEEAEMERCALFIREDLGLTGAEGYEEAIYLAEIHGGEPVPSACVETGETEGEVIRVNPRLPKSLLGMVILHELVHRLANSARYEELNPVRTDIPRREWLEMLACRIAGNH